jgi:thioesterase domain-containing protein
MTEPRNNERFAQRATLAFNKEAGLADRCPLKAPQHAPLFCIGFNELSGKLGTEQPVVSFSLFPSLLETPRISLLADRLTTELLAVQPQGPYLLAGYCFGGIVAFEIARRIVAKGQQVRLLALVEASCPGTIYWRLRVIRRLLLSAFYPTELVRYVADWYRERGQRAGPELLTKQNQAWKRFQAAMTEAINHHVAQPYEGQLILLFGHRSPGRFFPRAGWTNLARGGVEVHVVCGNHYTDLFKGDDLAEKMRECVAGALRMVDAERKANL